MSDSKKTQDYYSLLGVSRGADVATIKKAFRELAKTKHPDKGGNTEEFKDLSRAANVLQDPTLRAAYDAHGESGVEQASQQASQSAAAAAAAGHPTFHHFGFGGGQSRARMVIKVSATLEELFSGVDKGAAFSWQKPCSDCHRSGCRPGKSASRCRDCQGRGLIVRIRQLGPGIVQQQPFPCSSCNSRGLYISRKDRCHRCAGQQTNHTSENISVRVPKGAMPGQLLSPITESLARQFQDENILFVLDESPSHPTFKRCGPHLVHERTIPLVQALTGVSFSLIGVDGQSVRIVTPTDQIVSPGSFFRLAGQGLPKQNNTAEYGDLVVHVNVEFPTSLTPQVQHILRRSLPNIDLKETPTPTEKNDSNTTTAAAPSALTMERISREETARILEIPQQPPQHFYHHNLHQTECRTM